MRGKGKGGEGGKREEEEMPPPLLQSSLSERILREDLVSSPNIPVSSIKGGSCSLQKDSESSPRGSCVISKIFLCHLQDILCHLQKEPVPYPKGSSVISKRILCHLHEDPMSSTRGSCVISNRILCHLQIFLCHLQGKFLCHGMEYIYSILLARNTDN